MQQDNVHNGIYSALPIRDQLSPHGRTQPVPGRGTSVPEQPTKRVLRIVDLFFLASPCDGRWPQNIGVSR